MRLVLVALVSALLVACAAAPQSSTPTAAPVPKTLNIIQPLEVDSLDSHTTTKPAGFSVVHNIQDGLTARDPKTMQHGPSLATSWTTPNAQTWIFKLRTGVKFHNGEDFNAEAVKFNFDRIVKPELKSSAGASLAPVLSAVTVNDPATVTVTTKTPAPWLLERLARFWIMPPKETAEKGDNYVASHPIGTGPYKLAEWKSGSSVTLERNESYWGPKPAFQRVIFRQILEASTAISEILARSADILEQVPADQVAAVTRTGVADVLSTQTTTIQEVAFDALGRAGNHPWTDVRVRQAANYAIDREAIAKALFGGYGKPATSFLNPLEFGFDPTMKGYPYDVAKAKQLLTEAGYPNGFETNMTIFPLGQVSASDLAQAILNDLGKVGIRAKIQQITATEASPLINSGKIGPIWLRPSTCGSAFDAHLCFSFFTKGATNANWYSDALDDLRVRAGSTVDTAERLRLYSQAQQLVFQQAPVIFGWTGFYLSAVSKNIDWAPAADALTRAYLAKPK